MLNRLIFHPEVAILQLEMIVEEHYFLGIPNTYL